MLRINDRNTNYSGSIVVNDNEIAYISGSHNDNTAYISLNMENYNLFKQNIATVKTDLASFIDALAEIEEE